MEAETPPSICILDFSLVIETDLPPNLDPERLEPLVASVLAAERATGDWTIAVALVGDDRLRRLHRDFMGIDEATDVMTFPHAGADADVGAEPGGDIAISVDRAIDQAADHDLDPAAEIRFLLVHGLLHLCGWDDQTPSARATMLARQATLIEAFESPPDRRPPAQRETRSSTPRQ